MGKWLSRAAGFALGLVVLQPAYSIAGYRVPEGGRAPAPHAFSVFCQKWPTQCRRTGSNHLVAMTKARLAELRQVNNSVNRSIREVTDSSNYGRAELWALPSNGRGDCEDFALLKQSQLLKRGWPSSALLITIVRNRAGEGHVVLTVRTSEGDHILDSRSSSVRTPRQTGYRYFYQQSASNPMEWAWMPRSGTVPQGKVYIAQQ